MKLSRIFCILIQKNTTGERERMFTLFKDQSDRIDAQVKKLSASNDELMQENIKYRNFQVFLISVLIFGQ